MILAMIPADPLGTTRAEGPEENAGLVGIEDCGGAFEVAWILGLAAIP